VKVNIHEAKTQLSRLIERALKGEEVTIAKAGHPLVRLIPIHPAKPVLGSARGEVAMKPGWDAPMTREEVAGPFWFAAASSGSFRPAADRTSAGRRADSAHPERSLQSL